MNRADLYLKLRESLPSSYDSDFRSHVSELFKKYRTYLNDLDQNARIKNWDTTREQIERILQGLTDVIDLVYLGLHSQSHTKFKQISHLDCLSLFHINIDTNWYRVRWFDEKQNLSANDMFHIPLNKRGIVKTQRYSSTGYPCLYLGSSIYVCWEELHRPDLNRCFISRFVNKKEIAFYDMTIPRKENWLPKSSQFFSSVESDTAFRNDLIRMPLLLASMVKVKNDADVFKPEYIIPQQIMESIIEMNHNTNKSHENPVIGVIYSTVHQYDDFFPSTDEMQKRRHNIAVPIQNPNCSDYCDKLTSIFQLSKPTCEEFERMKSPFYVKVEPKSSPSSNETTSNKSLLSNLPNNETNKNTYEVSIFGQLETRINNDEESFKLVVISSNNKKTDTTKNDDLSDHIKAEVSDKEFERNLKVPVTSQEER